MTDLYPLRFRPLFKQYIWGGRRSGDPSGQDAGSGRRLCRELGGLRPRARPERGRVRPLAGTTLGKLVRQHGAELLGPPSSPGRDSRCC